MNTLNELVKSWQKENRALRKKVIELWNGGACNKSALHEVDRLNAKHETLKKAIDQLKKAKKAISQKDIDQFI